MRKVFFLFLFMTFVSCSMVRQTNRDRDRDGILDRKEGLASELEVLGILNNLTVETDKVILRDEMVNLFNPENFDCNCDEKLRKNVKEFSKNGYLPSIIETEVKDEKNDVISVNQNGANVLAHSFKIKGKDGKLSGSIFALTAPTVDNFEVLNYIEKRSGTYNNFYYTIDCNGYLTGLINAGVAISSSSIKLSASAASKSNKSLVIIKGLVYNPLYQAYKGEGVFSKDKELRKKVLNAIIHSATSTSTDDNTELVIASNYLVVVASNSGNSSFNGEASLNSSLNANFLLGGVNSTITGNTGIGRVSNYSKYKTYILGENINTMSESIKIKQIKTLINSI